jgi:hypothetical protein
MVSGSADLMDSAEADDHLSVVRRMEDCVMVNRDVSKPADVDAYMARLDHPFRAEVQALREIIKGVDPRITEQVRWNAPSFSFKGHMATFNLRARSTSTWCSTTVRCSRTPAGCSRAATRTGA